MKATLKLQEWKEQEVQNNLDYLQRMSQVVAQLKNNDPKEYMYTEEYRRISVKTHEWLKQYNYQNVELRARLIKDIEKEVDSHLIKLQQKVEDKIGEIQTITTLGNNDLDYIFMGTKGTCKTKVVIAGGWNIQCKHMRWTLSNIKTN